MRYDAYDCGIIFPTASFIEDETFCRMRDEDRDDG
jgi:hypothetical protein